VFYIKGVDCLEAVKKCLDKPGVYILYHDFDVFYIGQGNSLFERLQKHAMKRYRLWNHFSAFVVPKEQLDDVEAIMITATPRTANRSVGKRIPRINLPKEVERQLLKCQEIA
jgi:excinuclease UvrABC nuclease subunit